MALESTLSNQDFRGRCRASITLDPLHLAASANYPEALDVQAAADRIDDASLHGFCAQQ
jgi:hypothetical protein